MAIERTGGRATDPPDKNKDVARTIQALSGVGSVDLGEGETLGVVEVARNPIDRKNKADEVRPAQPGTHIVPMPETETEAYDAAKHLAEEDERRKKRNEERAKKEAKTYRYYLRCRFGHHGVYFVKNMAGEEIGDHDWFATYKRADEIWRQEVICQVCLKQGHEHRLDYQVSNWRGGKWRPSERWMWKVPIDPKRWRVEGDTRALDLPGEARNEWRERIAARLEKAGINDDE